MSVPDPTDRRRIVVLLGMHRAGTSVTMNVLNALGVPLSDDSGNPTMVMAAIHASSEKAWDMLIAKYDGIQPKQRRMFSNG